MSKVNIINLDKITRYIFLCVRSVSLGFLVYGIVLLFNSSKINYPLVINGKHADGIIVGYNQKSWKNKSTSTGFSVTASLPVVEFRDLEGQINSFIGKNGHSITQLGKHVKVIYSESNKKNAKINEGIISTWMDTWVSLFIIICSFPGIKFKPPEID